jgi:hypothetical protein
MPQLAKPLRKSHTLDLNDPGGAGVPGLSVAAAVTLLAPYGPGGDKRP